MIARVRRSLTRAFDDYLTRRHLRECEQREARLVAEWEAAFDEMEQLHRADLEVVAEALTILVAEWERMLAEGVSEAQAFSDQHTGWGG